MLTALRTAEQIDLLANEVRGKHAEKIRAAMREAERHLRERTKAQPLTEDAVRLLMDSLDRGVEAALYLEDRGYYKPMPVIIDRAMGESIRVLHSNSMHYVMELRDYNRTWRLWDGYPSGVEMKMAEWRARK